MDSNDNTSAAPSPADSIDTGKKYHQQGKPINIEDVDDYDQAERLILSQGQQQRPASMMISKELLGKFDM